MEKLADETNKILQKSRQPKNNNVNPDTFFASTLRWVKKAELEVPRYQTQSRIRDQWLREFVRQEPHIGGVLSTAVSLDTNRGYSLVGGRNQVTRFSKVLRDVENGKGWRILKQLGAQDYYSTDLGQVTEVETDGRNGPLLSLYHVDSARCELSGNFATPLTYYPQNLKEQSWKPEYYYRICSMQNPDETFYGLGYCAVSRCLKLAQIMIAIVEHDLEKLSMFAPKGLIAIESDDITQEKWDQAWDQHIEVQQGKTGNRYFDEAVVLVARAIKATVTPFSEMPDRFDPFKFMDYTMKGYALNFNLPTRYFWDIGGGSFGDVGEASIQSEKATQTGLANYMLQDQEQIQNRLPPSLLFLYEEDDTQGKIQKAELIDKWADLGLKLVQLGMNTDQVLGMMVKEGIIDPQFTPDIEEDIARDDEGVLQYRRQQLIEKEQIQLAVKRYENEPIVEYSWPDNKTTVLWKQGKDAIKKYYHIVQNIYPKAKGSRQKQQTDKMKEMVKLAENGDINSNELRERMVTYQLAQMVKSYFETATTEDNRTSLEQSAYEGAVDYSNNSALLDNDPIENNEEANNQKELFALAILLLLLPSSVSERMEEINTFSLESDFFDRVVDGDVNIYNRLPLWDNPIFGMVTMGLLFNRDSDPDEMVSWMLGNTEQHCETCLEMASISPQPRSFWIEQANAGIYPQSSSLVCGGFRCDCSY